MCPQCNSTIDLTKLSPIPVPSAFLDSDLSTCLNLSNIVPRFFSSMPIPLSSTDISTNLSLSLTLINISSPLSENFIAFDIRFNTTLSIFSGSQAIIFSSVSVSKIIFSPLISVRLVTDITISQSVDKHKL
jgi:hypothetical protein